MVRFDGATEAAKEEAMDVATEALEMEITTTQTMVAVDMLEESAEAVIIDMKGRQ